MMYRLIVGCVVVYLLTICISLAPAAKVELFYDVDETISDDDSLQDVFPQISATLPEGRIPPTLVDGRPQPNVVPSTQGNSVVLDHQQGPIFITWDLGENASDIQLDSLWLWMVGIACTKMDTYQHHAPNFVGRLSVSHDGQVFTVIPGSDAKLIAPTSKEFNLVKWTFSPGEVKGHRYLRIESFGYQGQSVRIAEVDGWTSGGTVKKSTRITTKMTPLAPEKVMLELPKRSQAQSAPMRVHAVKFNREKLVLTEDGRSIADFQSLLKLPNTDWQVVQRELAEKKIHWVIRRSDGLMQRRDLQIDDENQITLNVEIHLPDDTKKPADYTQTLVNFSAGEIPLKGCTYGIIPAFIDKNSPAEVQIGPWSPYLIFPDQYDQVELQVFMPEWYPVMGRINTFSGADLARFELFASARNTREELADKKANLSGNKWNPAGKTFSPGEKMSYRFTMAVFSVTPPTLGQKDIQLSGALPLVAVDTGRPDQTAPGITTVLQRDKMAFMGFKFREPVKTKIGHMIVDTAGTFTQPGIVQRLRNAGVGVAVLMGDEYVDVSHGVSANGHYDQSPEFLPAVLKKLQEHGIRVTYWFSPRGFLNKPWLGRPRDPLLDQHPEWFHADAHWFGNYQTLDAFNPQANQWVMDKFTQDMKMYPVIEGYAFDSFPTREMLLGPDRTTLTAQDQMWLKRYAETIRKNNPNGLVMANAATPVYDDLLSYDYTVTEHFPLMFLNEVQGGRAFGKPFIAHLQWRQLYGWYVTLGHMYYNFCDYDQTLGWMHSIWLGWQDQQLPISAKPVDEEVIPLWYIMGKGRRTYAAEIGENIRQIEVAMPDGSQLIAVAGMNAWAMDVQVVPKTIPAGKYRIETAVDNCFFHKTLDVFSIDTAQTPGIGLEHVAPYSITIMRFIPVKN